MATEKNEEVRFLKLEITSQSTQEKISKIEERVDSLEDDHVDQVKVLEKLSMTVNILSDTVGALNIITKELDKSQEVFKARFNIIIAILATIGVAVVTSAVKIIFFPGV